MVGVWSVLEEIVLEEKKCQTETTHMLKDSYGYSGLDKKGIAWKLVHFVNKLAKVKARSS